MQRVSHHVAGTSAPVVHRAAFQTSVNFNPGKLEQEIKRRANGHRWHACQIDIARSGVISPNTYTVTIIREDAIQYVFEIVREIEQEIKDAQEHLRLLGLLAEESDEDAPNP